MRTETDRVSLNVPAVARTLGAVAILLVLASLAGQVLKYVLGDGRLKGLINLFDLSLEQNIPAFFSMLLMVCASLLLAAIALIDRRRKARDPVKWAFLSIMFLYLAYDEICQIHEFLVEPVRSLIGTKHLGIFYYSWVIPGMAVVIAVALFFAKFVSRLPAPTRRAFVTAAALYVGGCIGFELLGGAYHESQGCDDLTYNLISTLEESFEMAGLLVFLRALMEHCARAYGEVRVSFGPCCDGPNSSE